MPYAAAIRCSTARLAFDTLGESKEGENQASAGARRGAMATWVERVEQIWKLGGREEKRKKGGLSSEGEEKSPSRCHAFSILRSGKSTHVQSTATRHPRLQAVRARGASPLPFRL